MLVLEAGAVLWLGVHALFEDGPELGSGALAGAVSEMED
jgi:hypothetical protein